MKIRYSDKRDNLFMGMRLQFHQFKTRDDFFELFILKNLELIPRIPSNL